VYSDTHRKLSVPHRVEMAQDKLPESICYVDLSRCFDYHVRLLFVVQIFKGASKNSDFAQVLGAGTI